MLCQLSYAAIDTVYIRLILAEFQASLDKTRAAVSFVRAGVDGPIVETFSIYGDDTIEWEAIMQVVILLGFVISLVLSSPGTVEHLAAPSVWIAPAAGVYLGAAAALAAWAIYPAVGALRRQGHLSVSAIRRHNLVTMGFRFWAVSGAGGLIALGYGRWVMQDVLPANIPIPLAAKAMVLGPFIGVVILGWVLDWPFHRAIRQPPPGGNSVVRGVIGPYWTLREHVAYNIRHHLLLAAVPIGLILLCTDAMEMYVVPRLQGPVGDVVYVGGAAAAAAGVFLLAPVILVRIWRTSRLPPGDLRNELEALCGRLKLKYRDILVWRSGGVIANAGVMGVIAPARYILVSDGILEKMTPAHIKAIFAHEGGHIVSGHLPYSVMFIVGTVALCTSATEIATVALGWAPWEGMLAMSVLLVVILVFGFGYISRRFERQSDIVGAWASGASQDGSGRIRPEGAALFAQALQRVGELNGIRPDQRSWRHGSIASRVSYILWQGAAGGRREDIDRTVRRIKMALWIILAAAVISIALQVWLWRPTPATQIPKTAKAGVPRNNLNRRDGVLRGIRWRRPCGFC